MKVTTCGASMAERESALESFFRQRVRLLNGYTVKLAPMEAGVPDRLVIFPGGRIFLVELKTENGSVSAVQKVWHDRMRHRWNVRVWVLYGREDVVRWLRAVVSQGDPIPRKSGPAPAPQVG